MYTRIFREGAARPSKFHKSTATRSPSRPTGPRSSSSAPTHSSAATPRSAAPRTGSSYSSGSSSASRSYAPRTSSPRTGGSYSPSSSRSSYAPRSSSSSYGGSPSSRTSYGSFSRSSNGSSAGGASRSYSSSSNSSAPRSGSSYAGSSPRAYSPRSSSSSYAGSSPRSYGAASSSRSYSSSGSSSGPRTGGYTRGPSTGFSGGSRFGGSSSRFGGRSSGGFGGSRGGGRGRGPVGERIDSSRFVNKVTVTEEAEVFIPEHKFTDFQIDAQLKQSIVDKGYENPTPIQDRAIPHVLKGQDVVGIANTGTGKTAAFLIPLISKVRLDYKQQVLIIVPTRELAIQIESELKEFTVSINKQVPTNEKIFGVCCVGGMSITKQITDLKYQYNFLIGTPGRLKDLIERKKIRLAEFQTMVLDEADRMLDMGFVADMRFVMAGMPKDHQTLFFSATLSTEIEKLIHEFLREPVRISVKTRDTSKNVEQDVVRVPQGKNKMDVLADLLKHEDFNKVIIFGRTKHGVESISESLRKNGFSADSIHGNKNHVQRQRALNAFKDNKSKILVATDVAARGLDIADVSHVINFDLPATYDDYVHRIGRTGRGNKKGKALTFIS